MVFLRKNIHKLELQGALAAMFWTTIFVKRITDTLTLDMQIWLIALRTMTDKIQDFQQKFKFQKTGI